MINVSIFFTGLGMIIYEVLTGVPDGPAVLVIFASMVGYPAFHRGWDSSGYPVERQWSVD